VTLENPDNSIENKQSTEHSDSKPADHTQETDPKNPPFPASSRTQPCAQHPEITYNTKRDWIDKTTLALEGFGLFVLCIYTVATIAIWCANKKAADAAKAAADEARLSREQAATAFSTTVGQFHLDQRAWLQIDPQSPQDMQPEGFRTDKMIIVEVKNTGKTPALHIHGHMKFQDIKDTYPYPSSKADRGLDFSYSDQPTYGQAIVSIPTLHPNGSFHQVVKGAHTQEAHIGIFVHGEVRYCDIFNEEHWAKFCFQWVPADHPQLSEYRACDKILTVGGVNLAPRNAIDEPNSPRQCKEK
jgi:hypothetical protein